MRHVCTLLWYCTAPVSHTEGTGSTIWNVITVSAQLPRDRQEKIVIKPILQLRKFSSPQRWHNLHEVRVSKVSTFSALVSPKYPPYRTAHGMGWIRSNSTLPPQSGTCITGSHSQTLPYKLRSAQYLVQSRDSMQFWKWVNYYINEDLDLQIRRHC